MIKNPQLQGSEEFPRQPFTNPPIRKSTSKRFRNFGYSRRAPNDCMDNARILMKYPIRQLDAKAEDLNWWMVKVCMLSLMIKCFFNS